MIPASSILTWFALVLFLLTVTSPGAVRTVTTNADSGPGSLRQAILDAGTNDTINIAVCGTISLTSGKLSITKPLAIIGPGPRRLAVMRDVAAPDDRVFDVTGGPATISALTVRNGRGVKGAGLYVYPAGSLKMVGCALIANHATAGIAGDGGAIYNEGALELNYCTLAQNTSDLSGSAIVNNNALTLVNCTIASNSAGASGGGAAAIFSTGTTVIRSCTFNDNDNADSTTLGPAGIWSFAGTVRMANTIVAGNDGTSASPDVKGPFISEGFNLIRIATGGTGFTAQGDQIGTSASPVNANLGPLQDNGGGTDTIVPATGSPARDQGKSFSVSLDQRGKPRPHDLALVANASGGDGTDIGALEVQPSQPWVVTTLAESGTGSINQVIEDAPFGATITFAPGLRGDIVLTCGPIIVVKELTITGPGPGVLTLRHSAAAGTPDVPMLTASRPPSGEVVDVKITGLAFAGGRAENGGAIVNNSIDLTLTDCLFTACSAGSIASPPGVGWGGALYNGGTLTVKNSTFQLNSANGFGGAIYNLGTLSAVQCLFHMNRSNIGGAVDSNSGSFSITDSTFLENAARSGGALYIAGSGTINRCTFSGNQFLPDTSQGEGGALHVRGTVNVMNSTFTANQGSYGAAILVKSGSTPDATLTLDSCTITGNTGISPAFPNDPDPFFGGGLAVDHPLGLHITNSIIAGNTQPGGGPDIYGTFTSEGFNLIGNSSGGTGFTNGVNHDKVGTNANPLDPKLGPLQDNGGLVRTCLPLTGSPALDAGKTDLTIDQRSWARKYDDPAIFDVSGSDFSDIGAIERQPGPPVFVQLTRGLNNSVNLTFKGTFGNYYQLQSSDALTSFTNFGVKQLAGPTGDIIFTDTRPLVLHRFYRAYRVP